MDDNERRNVAVKAMDMDIGIDVELLADRWMVDSGVVHRYRMLDGAGGGRAGVVVGRWKWNGIDRRWREEETIGGKKRQK